LLEYWSDPEVARYQYLEEYNEDHVSSWINQQGRIALGDPGVALVLAAELDGKVIGTCFLTITGPEDRQAEIGFTFNPRFTGKGLASRTVAVVLGFGFIQLGMHRIIGATDVRNDRSWRLMERIGMRREAHFTHDSFVKGQWRDAYIYAMLDEEWQQRYPDLIAVVTA
jgi:RimJ/RimL family protein N-acetyltransferase